MFLSHEKHRIFFHKKEFSMERKNPVHVNGKALASFSEMGGKKSLRIVLNLSIF